ncbi:cbb3-type cytochrome oxidase subunit 3 [Solimicrobium silvestre]|uniref:Cbb3-type cytochrome oxidase component FixQ n=1 Tax=Solimicrobium silvestre TaxID=2099400 RepID=A0A2S9H0H3_9BURK|nr:CcoQ/FixQ family Cbb3-type cytochrome c oxidase assembly chaperone [Solimicrobium silvestre]PRC93479.1 Cbb3-type cytochrome oxidase component FixQ [Solimicrobium silvestre]
MAIDLIFNNASVVMTVVSLITFLGILWWIFGYKRSSDFDAIANLPFVEDADDAQELNVEKRHV